MLLLRPFDCRIRVYDPWLPAEYVQTFGCEAASLDDVFRHSRLVIVAAGVTAENQGFLGEKQFSAMERGSGIVLVSRAAVVDFDTMLDFAEKGHIRVATDVFPEEPLSASHRARHMDHVVLCAHQAGALETALKQIGKIVVADAELILGGLPPVLCKSAQPETIEQFRSKPISAS